MSTTFAAQFEMFVLFYVADAVGKFFNMKLFVWNPEAYILNFRYIPLSTNFSSQYWLFLFQHRKWTFQILYVYVCFVWTVDANEPCSDAKHISDTVQ